MTTTKIIPVDSDDVIMLTSSYGTQVVLEFPEGSEISHISMGDTRVWRLEPVGNRISLTPMTRDAFTNATVITSDGSTYLFELHTQAGGSADVATHYKIVRF